jgi:hypothetical protein
MAQKPSPTLDIGRHSNAGRQARLEAGARHERTLFAVACTYLLGCYQRWCQPERRLPVRFGGRIQKKR